MTLPVIILDKDASAGAWVQDQLKQIGVAARWLPALPDLLSQAETQPPPVCLIALHPPVEQALHLITDLAQEPRFAHTALILMGPLHNKHRAFQAGATDYLITPLDVIETRKRVRLYLSRAELETRLVAETRITQEIESLGGIPAPDLSGHEPIDLLEHASRLTQERDLFNTILCSTDAALVLVDQQGTLLYANPAWSTISGHDLKALLGQRLPWPPQAASSTVEHTIAEAIEHNWTWQGDVWMRYPDDRILATGLHLTPALDASGSPIGFVLLFSADQARRESDETKLRFFADSILQMRTPVTNIKVRGYLLHQAPMLQRSAHLQALEREADRLVHMVDAMLELSHLDTGTVHITQEPVDLARMIGEILVRYSSAAEMHNITLGQTHGQLPPPLCGDSTQLARVLGILIDNAIQHTPKGGYVELRLDRESWTGGDYAVIQVKDTGIGIEAEALPHIFERFYRGERARDLAIRGVGLGLSIAEEITKRLGGHIVVQSAIDQGSTFTLWLPLT